MSEVLIPIGGSGGMSSDEVTASRKDILQGKTTVTSDSNDEIMEGTMPNCGSKTAELACGGSYTIPEGYHNGSGKVTAKSLAAQTAATAGAGDILSGKTAYVNGNKVAGTMPNRGAVTQALNCGGSYTIPVGYHNGSGKVAANSLASQTAANAVAGNILKDKTAWVNGNKITGTIPSLAGSTITPSSAQQTVACSGKYMSGNIIVKAADLKNIVQINPKNRIGWAESAMEYGTFCSMTGCVGTLQNIYLYFGIQRSCTSTEYDQIVARKRDSTMKYGFYVGVPKLNEYITFSPYYLANSNRMWDIQLKFILSSGTLSIVLKTLSNQVFTCGGVAVFKQ